ncbi:MAG: hypothetical protein AABX38_02970 [Candidatus Micrarchaeota archaeon]
MIFKDKFIFSKSGFFFILFLIVFLLFGCVTNPVPQKTFLEKNQSIETPINEVTTPTSKPIPVQNQEIIDNLNNSKSGVQTNNSDLLNQTNVSISSKKNSLEKYLLSFHACDKSQTDCNDPRNHKVYIAQSTDGANWKLLPNYVPYSGSVPDLIVRENILYVYTPGVLRRYQIDNDVWETPLNVQMTNSIGANELFADPSLILDEEKNLVMFYLVGQIGSDPARCQPYDNSCFKKIRSATEIKGSNGAKFIVDSGDRLEASITEKESASDPDVFSNSGGYTLLLSKGMSIQLSRSTSLRGSYLESSALSKGLLTNNAGGIPSGYYDKENNQYWVFVHTNEDGLSVIKRAVVNNLNVQIPSSAFTPILTGNRIGLGSNYNVESPGFAINED